MTAVPAIYGTLTGSQLAAYEGWNEALIVRAEHDLDCQSCGQGYIRCPAGLEANDAEQAAWQRWNAARKTEVPA